MSQILTYNLLHLHLSQGNKVLHYHNPLHPKDLLKIGQKKEKRKQRCIETLEAEDDDTQVQRGAENCTEGPQGDGGDVRVQRGAENYMEVPQGDHDDVQVQRGAETIEKAQTVMGVMYKSREVAENHMQLLERATDLGQTFRQWLGRGAEFFLEGISDQRQIRFTGEEKVLKRLPRNPTGEDFFKLYITEEMINHLVFQTNLYARQFLHKEKNIKP